MRQDLLVKTQDPQVDEQLDEIKNELSKKTDKTPYSIKLLAFRPSGIVQLDMGAQVQTGSVVTSTYGLLDNIGNF